MVLWYICTEKGERASVCVYRPCQTPVRVTISQPASQPASPAARVSHPVHLLEASYTSRPGTRGEQREEKREEERMEKERSIAPPTTIDQRSARRAWSITLHARPLSQWQDPNSQSQQTDEWYDKQMGPQMCLGPLISTRLVIKSADIWVAARANRHSPGWMEAAAVEPHRCVFIRWFTCG